MVKKKILLFVYAVWCQCQCIMGSCESTLKWETSQIFKEDRQLVSV